MGLITSELSGERALAVAGLGAGGPREAGRRGGHTGLIFGLVFGTMVIIYSAVLRHHVSSQ